jgi:DNA-binding NtrC family response regulator
MRKLYVLEAKSIDESSIVKLLVGRSIEDVERELILETLLACNGNRTHAAEKLGITVRTLRNKLAKFREEGIDVDGHGDDDLALAVLHNLHDKE